MHVISTSSWLRSLQTTANNIYSTNANHQKSSPINCKKNGHNLSPRWQCKKKVFCLIFRLALNRCGVLMGRAFKINWCDDVFLGLMKFGKSLLGFTLNWRLACDFYIIGLILKRDAFIQIATHPRFLRGKRW